MTDLLKKESVLLVDDDGVANFINYRLIKRSLLSEKIFTAHSGLDGLNFIKTYASSNLNNSPELIILDINMPHVDGFEFLESFYKTNFNNSDAVKIVVLSTSGNEKNLSKLVKYEHKKIGFITKPLTIEKLTSVLM